jgi:hypothetical protein
MTMKKRIEYEFTADDVAEYVQSWMDDYPIDFMNLETALRLSAEHLRNEREGIIAFCESRESELAEMESEPTDAQLAEFARVVEGKPAMSRFLPRRPDDVPAPPDGHALVMFGDKSNTSKSFSHDIVRLRDDGIWSNGPCVGLEDDEIYAIRWTASDDIWHRFGLLAPSEGGGWIPHTPGDPMPCDGDMMVEVIQRREMTEGYYKDVQVADCWDWEEEFRFPPNEIIGWRPALAEVRS